MPRQYRVGIVGFGMAGGALAVLLARSGHDVTVFERAPQVGPVGAGLLLQPSGQLVLQRMGLLDAVIAQCEPIYALRAFTARGGTLAHLRYETVAAGCCGYGVHRGTLFEALHAAVRDYNIDVCLDHHIVSWRAAGRQVFGVDAGRESHGPFDFLVAADGSRSVLRETVDPRLSVHEYAYGALWAVGRCTQVRRYLHQVTRGTRHLLGLLPIGNERCTLFWSLPCDRMDALRQAGFSAWRDDVIRLCPLAEETCADVADFDHVAFTTYQRSAMRHLHNDHVVCVGDAGHAMSPHLGQGANLALLDAECLALALQAADDALSGFRLYQSSRLAQIRYYATLSRLLTPFFQSEGWFLGLGRDIALPLMTLVPSLRREMEVATAGIKRGFLAGSMDVSTLGRRNLPNR